MQVDSFYSGIQANHEGFYPVGQLDLNQRKSKVLAVSVSAGNLEKGLAVN
jgi:hypothetical protein